MISFIIIIIITSLIAIWILTQFYYYRFHHRAPWLASPQSVRDKFLSHLELRPGQIFAELGAGSGSLARQLAQRYPTNQIYAYEISYLPFLIGSLLSSHYPNLNFIRGDIAKADLRMIDLCFVYTTVPCLINLATKLTKSHTKPVLVYSYRHQLPHHQPQTILPVNKNSIYLYKF